MNDSVHNAAYSFYASGDIMTTKFNSETIRKWLFVALALCFQLVSFYASFEGIKETFIAQTFLAFVFAAALNLSLLTGWHEFQQTPQVVTGGEDNGLAKRRSLALFIGTALLCLSAFLSSIGMYAVMGYKSGAETDSTVEYAQVFEKTKEIFNKVKDGAAKSLDAQKTELSKQLDAANKRAAQAKKEYRRVLLKEAARQIGNKINAIDGEKQELIAQKPVADEKLTQQQRNAELQTQISNIISDYGIERDKVLTADDKKTLGFSTSLNRNLYDQLITDLQNKKPLAIASVVFGVAPDLFAIALMFIATPRRKIWRRIRDAKSWIARVGREVATPADLPLAAAVEVLINDENQNPLAQMAVPIDFSDEVSEGHIRAFFPQIVAELVAHFGGNFEILDLPANWREALTAGEPLELTAAEI